MYNQCTNFENIFKVRLYLVSKISQFFIFLTNLEYLKTVTLFLCKYMHFLQFQIPCTLKHKLSNRTALQC